MRGGLFDKELQRDATAAAKKFAKDPEAITLESPYQDGSHVLFTVIPNDDRRSGYTLRVITPYLCGLVMTEIATLNAVDQVSFYRSASTVPWFQGTWGYMFEKYFLVWLCSVERALLPCTAKSSRSATSTKTLKSRRLNTLSLQPLGWEKLTVINGDSNFANAKDSNTPFGWLPVSRTFSSFDVVICTDENIITIQLTVSSNHSMKPEGFEQLKQNLPVRFEKARTWCHVFVTDCDKNATLLRNQHHDIAEKENISIYSAVLDISKCKISSADVERTFRTIVCRRKLLCIGLGTYLGAFRTTLLRWTPVGWR